MNTSWLLDLLYLVLDVMTLAVLVACFWIIFRAIYTMAQNKALHWESILGVLIVLALALGLLQFYPEMVIKSMRTGLEGARPEAAALRDELGHWLPRWGDASQLNAPIISTAVPSPMPAVTGTPAWLPIQPLAPTAVPPTSTPLPPTATIVPTIDLSNWNPQTPPPTPGGR